MGLNRADINVVDFANGLNTQEQATRQCITQQDNGKAVIYEQLNLEICQEQTCGHLVFRVL